MSKHVHISKPHFFKEKSVVKRLTTLGSSISIAFGIWHFFIPSLWNWYSYFDPSATELVIAVRAINIFFSLLLVLLGVANILFIFRRQPDRFSIVVMLSISSVLWLTRVVLQLVYPQGSQNSLILYSMSALFILVFLSFSISLIFILRSDQPENIKTGF